MWCIKRSPNNHLPEIINLSTGATIKAIEHDGAWSVTLNLIAGANQGGEVTVVKELSRPADEGEAYGELNALAAKLESIDVSHL